MSVSNTPVIVTRAEPGARETVQRLNALGYAVLRAPALTLKENADADLPAATELSGLIFTSANGVRAYASRRDDRSIAAWCVGPATAEAAKQAGFSTVHESAGNAVDLAQFIAAKSVPSDAPLLHVANAAAAGNLKRDLEARGFSVVFAALYQMQSVASLPHDVLDLIKRSEPALILIHSAKGAEAIACMLGDETLQGCGLVAISDAASAPLTDFAADHTFIADVPNEDGLLRALKRALATLSA